MEEQPDHTQALAVQIRCFCEFYASQVLTRNTRSVALFGRKCRTQLLDTFLGFELKAGRRRITCPDVTTARYLKIFAELGLASVEIPYDLSVTLQILPRLERSWEDLQILLSSGPPQGTARRLREGFRRLRECLKAAQDAR